MPYITISSLASSTGSSAYITVQIAYPILKSPNTSRASFVTYVEQNQLKTTSLSNSSSSLHMSCLPSVQSCFNTSIHVHIADQSSFAPAIRVSFMICSNLVQLHGQMPSATQRSKHTFPHLYPNFVLILFSASQVHP